MVRGVVRLARLAVRALPRSFREDSGDAVVASIVDGWRDAAGRPVLQACRLGRELASLVLTGLRERVRERMVASGETAGSVGDVGGSMGRWSVDGTLRDLWWDARLASRSLRRSPAFAMAVVATLSVALGGATTIAGLAHTVFWAQLPMASGDRLVRLRDFSFGPDGEHLAYNMNSRDFLAIREGSRAFDGVVGMNGYSLTLLTTEGAVSAQAIGVSEGWGRILGIQPEAGRLFTPEEEAEGRDAGVAVISHDLWERYFAGEPDAVGRRLRVDGGELLVVGVLPAGFAFPYDAQAWTPERFNASDWSNFDLAVFGTLRPHGTLEGARTDLDRIWAGLKASAPGTLRADGLEARMARADFIGEDAASLKGLAAAVLFLVILACANIASLFTVRLVARDQETALRAALGAGRLRLFRLAVVESVVLFLLGGVGGLAVTSVLGNAASTLIPRTLRTQLDLSAVGFGLPVLAFAAALAVAAGIATGAVAAIRATRVDLQSALREGGRHGGGRSGWGVQNALVVAELALALVLLQGAAVLVGHFRSLEDADLGFSTEGLYTAQLSFSQDRYLRPDARVALERSLEAAIGAVPGVEAVGMTTVNPLCCGDWGAQIRVEGREPAPADPPITVFHSLVTPGYFEAMGLKPLRGRLLGDEDVGEGRPVVVVDEAAARRFWPGQDPIGKRVARRDPSAPWLEVIGVVPTIYREGDYHEAWYVPFYQSPTDRSGDVAHFILRGRSSEVLAGVRRAIEAVDPTLAVQHVSGMRELRHDSLTPELTGAVVASLFAAVGLVLACLGLYGLLAYQVGLRSREIGTRLALGARAGQVVTSILTRTLRLVAAGSLVGGTLAYGLNVFLGTVVEGVGLAGPALVGGLISMLGVAALAAAAVPATRASRLDPAQVLKGE